MPPRPGVAARRFYRTFYHWTVLGSESSRTTKTGRHAFHYVRPAGVESNGTESVRIRKHVVTTSVPASQQAHGGRIKSSDQGGQEKADSRRRKRPAGSDLPSASPRGLSRSSVSQHVEKPPPSPPPSTFVNHVPAFFTESPILSPTQKPFSTFGPREQVVRYRSSDGIMLELAVVDDILRAKRARYGPDLKAISQHSGARIEVQNISAPSKEHLESRCHSVLCSGTFDQVSMARYMLRSDVAASMTEIHSQAQLPSKSLLPGKLVLRARQGSQVVAELSILEEEWELVVNAHDWARVAIKKGAALEVGLLESRPVHAELEETALARSLIIRGTVEDVSRFHNSFGSYVGRTKLKKTTPDVPAPPQAQATRHEQQLKSTILIGGKDAFYPGFVDAVSSSIGSPPPAVKVYRSEISTNPVSSDWKVEVFGPLDLVVNVRTHIQETIAKVAHRMDLKSVRTSESSTRSYKYTLMVTGGDAIALKGKAMANVLQSGVETQYGVRHIRGSYADTEAQWRERIKVEPEFINPVRKRLLECVRQAGDELGLRNFKARLSHDPAGVELSPAKSLMQSKANSTVASSSGEKQNESRAAEAPRTSLADGPSGMPPRRADSDAPCQHQPERSPEQQKQLVEDIRSSLRSLTQPVVLVTSQIDSAGTQLSPAECARGVTVSSFNTVTLDPHPTVSFNLKVPSRSWDAICQSRKLCVHLLQASDRGAAVAHVFTKPHNLPEKGFEELTKFGLQVRITEALDTPIISDSQGAVLGHFKADLLPEKCVRVGDHVVVLAEVTSVDMHAGLGGAPDGLAYAKRQYRARGNELVPVKPPTLVEGGPNDPLMLAEAPPVQSYAPLGSNGKDDKTSDDSDPHASFNLGNDPIYNALQATKDAAESGQDIDIYAAMAMKDEGFGDEMWPSEVKRSTSRPSPSFHKRDEPLTPQHKEHDPPANRYRRFVRSGESSTSGELDQQSTQSQSNQYRPVRPLLGESLTRPTQKTAAPKLDGSEGNSFSTMSSISSRRAFSSVSLLNRRGFSSAVTAYQKNDAGSHLIDPDAKTSTVADFLGVPDNNKRPHTPRVRSLVRFQKEIDDAKRRLKDEELSEEETATLQNSVAHQERVIARKLAWNAAGDLRLMLDKGNARVDFKRAQWLESAVEEGLNVLLDDARRLRQKREEGKVDAENYEMLRQKLETDYGALQTELMRLRDVADDDQD